MMKPKLFSVATRFYLVDRHPHWAAKTQAVHENSLAHLEPPFGWRPPMRVHSRLLYPAILVSLHTGLRNEELRLLRWRQVDLLDGSITVGRSKTDGGKGRIVFLNQTVLRALKEGRSQFPEASGQIQFLLQLLAHLNKALGCEWAGRGY
jgi:integrase